MTTGALRGAVVMAVAVLVVACAGPMRGMRELTASEVITAPPAHQAAIVFLRPSIEAADFMDAELEPGKTYYALVTPRMGVWKARFSLRPVAAAELDGAQLREWLESCEWVENTEETREWARRNAADVQSKRVEYLRKWEPRTDKPILHGADGR